MPPSDVTVHLEKLADPGDWISFGLPLPDGALEDMGTLRVYAGKEPLEVHARPLLHSRDADGAINGLTAVLIQLPGSVMTGDTLDVRVALNDTTGAAPKLLDTAEYSAVSMPSPEVVETVVRSIEDDNGTVKLVELETLPRELYPGREPRVLATFPEGYLAKTGILGPQVTAPEAAAPGFAGMTFLSSSLRDFALSAMYDEGYAVDAYQDPNDAYAGPVVDPMVAYEGWLYDRCATFLTAHAHTGDPRFLRHALRTCAYYSDKIQLAGPDAGTFTGKPTPDNKYSHLRGLYAYYALTGDEGALASGKAIAELWINDATFVVPYREGHVRGPDKLWTERLLGHGMEGLYYGHRLIGDTKYLGALREMVSTAHAHITTEDQAALDAITTLGGAGYPSFPAQNCFIHSALQHSEGEATAPWCSAWMSELTVDALLAYQRQTGDQRVDEIFVRLARFLRDVGTSYFDSNPLDDTFLEPSVCYDPMQGEDVRRLVPLYGAGLDASGARVNQGEYDDFEHCADATALTAAAIRALTRQGLFDKGGPIGPFASEGESFVALHHELAACARGTFEYWNRPRRNPSAWTSDELAAGLGDPQAFIVANKIGWPSHPSSPLRKLSWWFNMSMLGFSLLQDAGVEIPELKPGAVQPAGCP